jgi:hypothetical protein
MNTDERKLNISERKILRKIYAPNCVNGLWRIKNNDELYSKYKEPSIGKMTKTARMKLLGYIARMEDNVTCMKIKFYQPDVSRKKGRPRLSWLVLVSKDIKILEVNAW